MPVTHQVPRVEHYRMNNPITPSIPQSTLTNYRENKANLKYYKVALCASTAAGAIGCISCPVGIWGSLFATTTPWKAVAATATATSFLITAVGACQTLNNSNTLRELMVEKERIKQGIANFERRFPEPVRAPEVQVIRRD